MIRICAWCKKIMGEKEPDQSGTTHGICDECFAKLKEKKDVRPT